MKQLNNLETNMIAGGMTYWCQVTKKGGNDILATFEMVKGTQENTKKEIYDAFKDIIGGQDQDIGGKYHISCHKYDR